MLADFTIVIGAAAAILLLAELVIRQALRVAHHFSLSGSFIGLTILSIGTSLLEITTHVIGSLHILSEPETMQVMSGLLIGTNVGSDIFQQNFVLPIIGLLACVQIARRNLLIEVGALLGASLLLWVVCLGGSITRLESLLLGVAYLAYLVYLGNHGVRDAAQPVRQRLSQGQLTASATLITICFVGMAIIADYLLEAASHLVAQLPLSASLFGVIVLGVCAALPELMTCLVSVYRGEKEMSAGILIGSNITNPLLGVGLGGMISSYTVPPVVLWYDLPIKIATGGFLYYVFYQHQRIRRLESASLLATYVLYILLRHQLFPAD